STGEIEVATEAAETGDGQGEIELALVLEPAALILGEGAVAERPRLGTRRGRMRECKQLAVNAEERWAVGRDVEVGRAPSDRLVQEWIDGAHRRAMKQRACQLPAHRMTAGSTLARRSIATKSQRRCFACCATRAQSAGVMRRTSSTLVAPLAASARPACRRLRMPALRARRRSSGVLAPATIPSRSVSPSGISS